jgi:hypothetical protein
MAQHAAGRHGLRAAGVEACSMADAVWQSLAKAQRGTRRLHMAAHQSQNWCVRATIDDETTCCYTHACVRRQASDGSTRLTSLHGRKQCPRSFIFGSKPPMNDDGSLQWRDAVERLEILYDCGSTTFVADFTHSFDPEGETYLLGRELLA